MRQYTEALCEIDTLRKQVFYLMLDRRDVPLAAALAKQLLAEAAELWVILEADPSLKGVYWTPRSEEFVAPEMQ